MNSKRTPSFGRPSLGKRGVRGELSGARLIALLFLLFFFAACSERAHYPNIDFVIDSDSAVADEEKDGWDTTDDLSDDVLLAPDVPFVPDDSDPDGLPDHDLLSPKILSLSVTMNPNEAAPLVGVITATTEPATRLRVTLESDEGTTTLRFAPLATQHRLPILGLRPDTTYTVHVAVESAEGATAAFPTPFTLATPPLHPDFPALQHTFLRSATEREPGYTFAVINGALAEGSTPPFNFQTVAFDREGVVRWYFWDAIDGQHGIQTLSNGHLLLQFSQKIIEIDLFGDIQREWRPEGVPGGPGAITLAGVSRFHHAAVPTIRGTILTLDFETRIIEDFPTSETDPTAPTATQAVRGDVIVEFAPEGTVVQRWHLFDILDPYRIGYTTFPGLDWSHSNYVFAEPSDDSVVLSVRNQSCIVKFDRLTGAIRWILGTHDQWGSSFLPYLLTPVGTPFLWMWYQHNAKLTPHGTILVFDNGAYRAMPYDPPLPPAENWSRAVEYKIDEAAMTVEQVWEWPSPDEPHIFSAILGDVLFLPERNHILIAFGSIATDENGAPVRQGTIAHVASRIVEVTHTTPAQPLYSMHIADSTMNNAWRVSALAFRRSLYPDGMLETP